MNKNIAFLRKENFKFYKQGINLTGVINYNTCNKTEAAAVPGFIKQKNCTKCCDSCKENFKCKKQ